MNEILTDPNLQESRFSSSSNFIAKNTRFCEKVEQGLANIRYEIADTPEKMDAILQLRYQAYLREKIIIPNEHQRLPDKYDDLPNVYNVGLYVGEDLLSALRIHVLTKDEPFAPSYDVYGDVIGEKIENGAIMVDGNRFVANYPLVRTHPYMPYVTVRLAMLAAEHFGAQYSIAAVRQEHYAFYKKEYLANIISEFRTYPTLTAPLMLISTDYWANRDAIFEHHRFYDSTAQERVAIFGSRQPRSLV